MPQGKGTALQWCQVEGTVLETGEATVGAECEVRDRLAVPTSEHLCARATSPSAWLHAPSHSWAQFLAGRLVRFPSAC